MVSNTGIVTVIAQSRVHEMQPQGFSQRLNVASCFVVASQLISVGVIWEQFQEIIYT